MCMLTPGLSLILLNCMERIIVILRLSGKVGTLILLTFGKDSVLLINLTWHLLQCFMIYAGIY